MRIRPVVLVAAVLAAGCSAPPPPVGGPPADDAVRSRWREPAHYAYTLDSRCGEQPLIGRYRITVAGGAVTDVRALDEAAQVSGAMAHRQNVPTLGRLLEYVDIARRTGAAVASADFDPADGHPIKISIDQNKTAVDDELCFTVADYAPGAPSAGP
jgi:Family of unknown function (DUF6174)